VLGCRGGEADTRVLREGEIAMQIVSEGVTEQKGRKLCFDVQFSKIKQQASAWEKVKKVRPYEKLEAISEEVAVPL